MGKKKNKTKHPPRRPAAVPADVDPADPSFQQGTQYAVVRGLLDPAYPTVAFIVELPFPVTAPLAGAVHIVVPMAAMRTGERDDTHVRVRFGTVMQADRASTAPFAYLRALPGRKTPGYGPVPPTSTRSATSRRPVAIVELATPNVLPDAAAGAGDSEIAVRLFARCLDGLNRALDAYTVATEDHAVRPLSAEALDHYALVELRDELNQPVAFGGLLTLPRATTPETHNQLSDDDLLLRMTTSMQHEAVAHPVDTVVRWHVRANHYSQTAGDYEMALLALNVSAEVLLDALWDTHRVDRGQDSSLYDRPHQFSQTLRTVASELDLPWDPDDHDNPWTHYDHGCYTLRNETTHEGRHITAEQLDGAFEAYDALRTAVEQRTLATAQQYPRTALLVHGPVGLQRAGALVGRVADELAAIRLQGSIAFWLPHDLREKLQDRSPGGEPRSPGGKPTENP